MKIKLVAKDRSHIQLEPLLRTSTLKGLQDFGITFVTTQPDILLVHTHDTPPDELLQIVQERPSIIVERIASANLYSRRVIGHPNVVGVAKDATFRDPTLNNMVGYHGRYHAKLLATALGLPITKQASTPPLVLGATEFAKIELWYSFAVYKKMSLFIRSDFDPKAPRPIDVCFAGTTVYGETSYPMTVHRSKCVKAIQRLEHCITKCYEKRALQGPAFADMLAQTKVALSPWGLGEKCWRDYEIIYSGAVMVRPDTSHVLGWPDIYQNTGKYYIDCKCNFSDLQEKVDWIKTNWGKLTEMRAQARQDLLVCCKPAVLSAHLAKLFTSCAARIK